MTYITVKWYPDEEGSAPPFGFTDDELNSITGLAQPLPPTFRDGFLWLVANKLSGYPPGARGPGLMHHVAAEIQRDLLKGGMVAVGIVSKARRGRYG